MNVVSKNVNELFVSEKNVRKHPALQLEELKRSYEMFGQYRPLVVTTEGEILVGNGLYTALKDSVDKLDCIVLPENTSPEFKKKLMLADNKVFELGANDYTMIDEIFKEMNDFNVPGFDSKTLEDLYSESIDALESIDRMFKVPDEKVNSINNIVTNRENGNYVDLQKEYEENPNKTSKFEPTQQEPADIHKGQSYVNCPHCGMKIWL